VDTGASRTSSSSSRRARRSGGDIAQIEQLVDRHLQHSEFSHLNPMQNDSTAEAATATADGISSPFYTLYLRRLLSGLPVVPHESFSHPVAGIIAISSRNPNPIEELRRLYNRQHDGDLRFPQWVENDFLRYYVLIHDEETGDIAKSNQTFDSMKRHFGLHCHLLRLKSQQCIPSDDDSMPLPTCEWMSASEELAEIHKRGMLQLGRLCLLV
jgi:trafficking protein particle complex subunit 8